MPSHASSPVNDSDSPWPVSILTPHRRLSAVTAQQTDEQFLRGGLARAAGTEKPEDLPAADGEVHAAHSGRQRLGITEREIPHANHVGYHACGCGGRHWLPLRIGLVAACTS